MRSDELGNEVEDQITRLWTRIMGVGKEQYEDEDDVQLFETMPLEKLFEYAREELDDIIVYAVMLRIRLNRAEQAIKTTGGMVVTGDMEDMKAFIRGADVAMEEE